MPSDVDETLEPMALPDAVAALALRKARAVAASRRAGLVLAADTIVVIDAGLEGSRSNVVGLPLEAAAALLRRFGVAVSAPPPAA